jgi:long-subunit acyl-CoA synthetase (AMP-forming)
MANCGAIAAGGVAAGIYATNLADSCKYISEHSKAKVVVCEGVKQLEKYYEISKDLPNLKALVMYLQISRASVLFLCTRSQISLRSERTFPTPTSRLVATLANLARRVP